MMNKFLAIAGASAMLLSAATPALADRDRGQSSEVRNHAYVSTELSSYANSGKNLTGNVALGHRAEVEDSSNDVLTNDATSEVGQLTVANTNVNGDCDRCSAGELSNDARVRTELRSSANSGKNITANVAVGGEVEDSWNMVTTGRATSRVNSWTVVNTNVSLD